VFCVLAFVFAGAALALGSQFVANPWVMPVRRPPEHKAGLISDYRKLAASSWSRFIVVAVFFEGLLFFGGFTYVAAYLHTRFALSFSLIGLAVAGFGLGSLLYAMTVRALVMMLREQGLVLGGGIVVMLGYFLLAATPLWEPTPLLVATLGFGYYMLHNTLQTNATQMLPESRGTAVAAFSSALFLGQSAGVAIAAPIVDRAGAATVFIGAAVLWPVLALWIVRRLARR
jgi:YNFM family putative membrane transporter